MLWTGKLIGLEMERAKLRVDETRNKGIKLWIS
jgi:hypothetical protein